MHSRYVLLALEVSRADGASFLLHEPVGESTFYLQRSPDGVGLDVVEPRVLSVRGADGNNTVSEQTFNQALYQGWQVRNQTATTTMTTN